MPAQSGRVPAVTNHMQPDDQQSPATEAAPASAEAAEPTVPAEARPVPEVVPDAPAHGDSSWPRPCRPPRWRRPPGSPG
ncbi:hypothetical protein MICRO116_340035 [Micrococcus sp. 116]|nr:hypothetical protein MICRO116_340035 [Micrococcus sp. 116]